MVVTGPVRNVLRTLRSQRPITVRNALLRDGEKEALSTRDDSLLKWYSCGPTVYDDAHLGHARAYVSFDIIRRIISSLSGVYVDYVLGVTDIDDKILQRASEQNIDPSELASRYEARFFEDMEKLHVLPPTKVVRVTEHISELQSFIEELMRSGAAYARETGNVYFSVAASEGRYAQLDPSRGKAEEGSASPSPHVKGSSEKRDQRDFALWKSVGTGNQKWAWDSQWGRGRPGWHIECSAMAMGALGPYLDLHTGGIDLRFPHHTNELATAEAKLCMHKMSKQDLERAERWSHTWLHAGHLHISGRKMSKSVKNFITIRDYFESGGTADAFRIFCLLHKYSSSVEYSEDRLSDAQSFISRIRRFAGRNVGLAQILAQTNSLHPACPYASSLRKEVREAQRQIDICLSNDFDTPQALAQISKVVTAANSMLTKDGDWMSGAAALAYGSACELVKDTLSMLGLSSHALSHDTVLQSDSDTADSITEAFVKLRAGVRGAAKRKDLAAIFELCDGAREEALNNFGVRIMDRKDGSSTWTRD